MTNPIYFTVNIECEPLHVAFARCQANIEKLRREFKRRHLIGRWRQKTLAARIRSLEHMGALAWIRIINEDAAKNNIH